LDALDSLRVQTVVPDEIVVVVDHNPSREAELREVSTGVRVIENAGPRGLSGARNTGVEASNGAIIAFLDDDAVAAPTWLEQLLVAYEDPRVIGAGGRVVPAWGSPRPEWFPEEFDWVIGCTYAGHPELSAPVRNPIGANMSFRRTVFAHVGGFSDSVGRTASTPAGCEETELSIRATRGTGGIIQYVPDAVVAHHVPAARTRFGYYLRRCLAEGRSKRFVASLVGRSAGLESERAHVRRALPEALGRELRAGRIACAGAIVAGIAAAAFGYVTTSARGGLRPARPPLDPLDEATPVTIVVATRDRPEALARCLDSLLAQDHPAFEILVVDNAPSADTSATLVGSFAEAHATCVRYAREDRPGLAHAHNRGIELTTTPIVAFTDDDVVADPSWLRHLTAGFASESDVACVTGLIEPLELETQAQRWLEEYAAFGKGSQRRAFSRQDSNDDPMFPYRAGTYGSGANMAFRTDVLRRLGGFDGALGAGTPALGGDDLAAFVEVLDAGYRLVYEPSAVVKHEHRREYEGLRRQAFGYGAGLTAYVSSVVWRRPARIAAVARRLPAATRYALDPASAKNARLPVDYPRELRRLELRGMLVGPLYYARSRRWARTS
jgi:GT2 family glycosyltransferase